MIVFSIGKDNLSVIALVVYMIQVPSNELHMRSLRFSNDTFGIPIKIWSTWHIGFVR